MKLKLIAVAAFALSAGAHADMTFDLGTVAGTVPITNTVDAGPFTDTFNFNLASLSDVKAIALNTSYFILPAGPTLGLISLFQGALDGVPLTLSVTHDQSNGIFDLVLEELSLPSPILMSAGPHTLVIAGIGIDPISSLYTGSITVSDAPVVPEPATVALLSLGLAGLGFSRRKQ